MNNDFKKMEFFPALDTLDSEKLRFLKKFKQDVEKLGNDYSAIQMCHKLLLDLAEKVPVLANNSVLISATGFCQSIIDSNYTDINFRMFPMLQTNLFPAIEEAIISEEFILLEAHRSELSIFIQATRHTLKNALESTTSDMEQILIQFMLLNMPDIPGRLYHFYRSHYPRHYLR